MYIVLIGPPGCGKGTQSQRLRDAYGLAHVSTGDMLREALRDKTPVGQRVASLLAEGQLVSDGLISDLVAERLQQPDCERGCLFDGIPRTLPQAAALDDLLAAKDQGIDTAVEITVAEEELTRRILLRAETEQRADDNLETLTRRLEVYKTQTAPILEHYRQQGKLRTIDGDGTPEDVFGRIRAGLEKE